VDLHVRDGLAVVSTIGTLSIGAASREDVLLVEAGRRAGDSRRPSGQRMIISGRSRLAVPVGDDAR